jgi:hypothetical protein
MLSAAVGLERQGIPILRIGATLPEPGKAENKRLSSKCGNIGVQLFLVAANSDGDLSYLRDLARDCFSTIEHV